MLPAENSGKVTGRLLKLDRNDMEPLTIKDQAKYQFFVSPGKPLVEMLLEQKGKE